MRDETRSWLLTAAVFVIAAAFTVFCGISIASVSRFDKTQEESSSEEPVIQTSVADEDPSVETISPGQTSDEESEPEGEDEDEDAESKTEKESKKDSKDSTKSEETTASKAETSAPVDASAFHALSQAEIDSIRSSYDGTVQTFYGLDTRDAENRPSNLADLSASLNAQFNNKIHIFTGTDPRQLSLTFLETMEYDNHTTQILDILQGYGVPATFFVTYSFASANPDLIKRMINEGHEIGSLGYNFPEGGLAYSSLEQQSEDIMAMHQYMQNTYGYTMSKFYFGYEVYSMQSLAAATSIGYDVVFYSVNYIDYSYTVNIDANTFLATLQEKLHNGAVYSLHTVNIASVQVLTGLLNHVLNNGYQVTLIK